MSSPGLRVVVLLALCLGVGPEAWAQYRYDTWTTDNGLARLRKKVISAYSVKDGLNRPVYEWPDVGGHQRRHLHHQVPRPRIRRDAVGQGRPHLTVSVGIATMLVTLGMPETELIKAADEALYRAKAGGRNQIVA